MAFGSVSVGYSVHNEHASSRDNTVRHMHAPFGAVVAHIRILAVRRKRGSEECVIHAGMRRESWALNFHHFFLRSRALNPTLKPRATTMRFLHLSTLLQLQGVIEL